MDLIKIENDSERAKSLFRLSMLRYNKISQFDSEKESSLISESYYEICKELITSVLFLDGYKTLSHKDLVEYVKMRYNNNFNEHEINVLDNLRKKRNKLVYYGVFVDSDYVSRNKNVFDSIINTLKKIIEEKLK